MQGQLHIMYNIVYKFQLYILIVAIYNTLYYSQPFDEILLANGITICDCA